LEIQKYPARGDASETGYYPPLVGLPASRQVGRRAGEAGLGSYLKAMAGCPSLKDQTCLLRFGRLLTTLIQLDPVAHVTFVGHAVVAYRGAFGEFHIIPEALGVSRIKYNGRLAAQGVGHLGILLGRIHGLYLDNVITHSFILLIILE